VRAAAAAAAAPAAAQRRERVREDWERRDRESGGGALSNKATYLEKKT